MEELIRQRNQFEDELYDMLVSPLLNLDDFWDPVRVSYDIHNLESVTINQECIICISHKLEFKYLSCCKQYMCIDCSTQWFNISVKCPNCIKDLR